MKVFTLEDIINFGKYKGYSFSDIIELQPNYIIWCLKNIEWFCLSDELFNIVIEYKVIEKEAIIKLLVENNENEMNEIEKNSKKELFELNEIKRCKILHKSLENNVIHNSKNHIFNNDSGNYFDDNDFYWGGLSGEEAYDAMWNCD